MKLMKKSFSMLLAVAMVFTATFGCMTVLSFAADSGTGSGAAEMTGFSFENVEGPESGEAGQTISLNILFNKNVKILDVNNLMSELIVKISGKNVTETKRDITMSTSGKVLNIKMVSNDWAAIYGGALNINADGVSNLVTTDNDKPVKLEDFTTYIPVGIMLENKPTAGTTDASASDIVQVTHRANMRGMYHFQLMSNGNPVLPEDNSHYYAGAMTSHAHAFNTTITEKIIASAMANAINSADCGYAAEYQADSDTFIVTADEAKDGEELTVQMFEANADCRDQKAILAKAKADLDGVANNTNPAIDKAYEAYTAFMAKDDSSKTQMDYIKLINQMNDSPTAPAEIADGSTITLTGTSTASISLKSVPNGWAEGLTELKVQQVGIENDVKSYTAEEAGLKIENGRRGSSLSMNAGIFRNESTTSGKKSAQFMITLTSTGFKDCSTVVNVKNYGAQKFYVRYLDKNGKVITTNTYTMDQLKSFSMNNESKVHENMKYQSYCSMAGLRNFCADGVYIEDLLKDSGVTDRITDSNGNIKDNVTVKIRTNDSVKDGSGNDSTTDNAYYWMGTFDYKYLFQERYYFPAVYTNDALKEKLLDGTAYTGDESADKRAYLWENGGKEVAGRPMIAWDYVENVYSQNQTEPSRENYNANIQNERSFRFLFSLAKDPEAEATENKDTTFSVTHCAFGIDIIDGNYEKPSHSGSSSSGSSSTVTPVTKYTVNKPADSAEGKVSVSPSGAEKGDTVTVTVTPADGYKTGNVTVTDKSGNKVSVSGSDNKYTFKMPASNVTVKVTYEKTAAAEQPVQPITLPFKDVKTDRWSYSAIKYAYENKLFSGTSADKFSPTDEMTRGMLVTVLYRFAGEPAVNGDAGFADIKSGDWYAKAVAWAKANNIVSGVSAAEFAPNKDITREQMAAILHRYAAYKSYSTAANGSIAGFNDNANVSAFAKDAVSWAVGEKLISGTGNNTLAPKGNATREQVAAILQRFAENIAK